MHCLKEARIDETRDVTAFLQQLVAMYVRSRLERPRSDVPIFRIEVFQPMSLQALHPLYEIDRCIRPPDEPRYHKFICICDVLDDRLREIRSRQSACLLP